MPNTDIYDPPQVHERNICLLIHHVISTVLQFIFES